MLSELQPKFILCSKGTILQPRCSFSLSDISSCRSHRMFVSRLDTPHTHECQKHVFELDGETISLSSLLHDYLGRYLVFDRCATFCTSNAWLIILLQELHTSSFRCFVHQNRFNSVAL